VGDGVFEVAGPAGGGGGGGAGDDEAGRDEVVRNDPVAEVSAADGSRGGEVERVGTAGGPGLEPAGLHDLADRVGAGGEVEGVAAIGPRDVADLAGVEGAVAVRVRVDRPARQAALVAVDVPVGVEVVERDAGDEGALGVAEVG